MINRPLLLGIPLVFGDIILNSIIYANQHLDMFYTNIGGDILIGCLLLLGLTYLSQPRPTDRDNVWLRRGKRAYSWNILTSFIICSKTALIMIFVSLSVWLGY